jgi:hypothetical protein
MPAQSLAAMGNTTEQYLSAFVGAEGKAGKTSFLAASCLGALPWQTEGLVDKPENLHIIGFDAAFADGLVDFITKRCGRSDAYLNVSVRSLTGAAKDAGNASEWDYAFYSAVMREMKEVKALAAKGGVHAVVISSLTGLAEGLVSGLSGPPKSDNKGAGMSMPKWGDFARQVTALRNEIQDDKLHVFWEGHISVTSKMEGSQKVTEESIAIPGQSGRNFGFNVGHVMRLRRELAKYPGTQVDKVFLDMKPTMGFMSNGRGAAMLSDRETDLVVVAKKLGKKVGGFKA